MFLQRCRKTYQTDLVLSKVIQRKMGRQKIIMKYYWLEIEKIIHIMVFNLFSSY